MKVQTSTYITAVKPLLKKLLSQLLDKYEYASILAADSISKKYGISRSGTSVSDDFMCERAFVVRIFHKGEACEYSFDDISESRIPEILSTIEEQLLTLCENASQGGNVNHFPLPSDEPLNFEKCTEYELSPEDLGDEKIIGLLNEIRNKGLEYDEAILDCNPRFSYQRYTKLFLSKNRDLTQNIMWSNAALFVISPADSGIATGYLPRSGMCGAELINELLSDYEIACKQALELRFAEPMIPGEYTCICNPEVTGMIVHEAFGHGVEMDMFVKDRALAKDFIGEYVASPLITMRDGAASASDVASYFFDDEGNVGTDTVIIDKGILVSGMCDELSAMHLNCRPTGNGRRETTARKAYTRMTNTFFEPGTDKVEDMIASVDYGFLLEQPSSGMEDPKNWGIQCLVTIAREIRNGRLTGKLYSPIVLTGYVPDLLKSITMVSDSMETCGTGFCGKGYKEYVKVSDGGPFIKARIRLG